MKEENKKKAKRLSWVIGILAAAGSIYAVVTFGPIGWLIAAIVFIVSLIGIGIINALSETQK